MTSTAMEPGPDTREAARPHPERVLLATDGGLAGVAAVRWIAARSRRHALEVHIVDVVDADPRDFSDVAAMRTVDAIRAGHRARDLLLELAPGTVVRVDVERGEPVPTLQELGSDTDLVVVGSNRTTRGLPHLTSSFAARLAAWCPCSIVTVPRGWTPSDGPVVVGAQGDGSDAAALEFAAREAAALDRDLVVVHARRIADVVVPAGAVDPDRAALERGASDRLAALAATLLAAHPGLRIAPVLGHDDPVRAIVRTGRGASLVVVGTHGLTDVDRLLLRSVSHDLLERPSCPIAVVPPAGPAVAP